ncbi:MAG: hypothetical protein D8M58_13655 [Calditrichaeota bacterium]|nr:MAG: hypothetical protein DWQ03_14895 [Calditrichota bacterium]MBL1206445.1 hypothetical protein [Calditrichota bacterium]NOG46272.1 hypothetical protein [Calditrichota bacterium]
MRYLFRTSKTFLILFVMTGGIFAQTFNMQGFPSNRAQFAVSFMKSWLDSPTDYSTFSGLYELSANIPITLNYNFVTSLPISNVKWEVNLRVENEPEFEESGVGNVFIGVQSNNEVTDGRRSSALFGVFLPTADEKAAPFGLLPNAYEMQKYSPDIITLYFNYAVQKTNNNGFRFGFEIGPSVFVPTGDNKADTEFVAHFGLNMGIETPKIYFGLEFIGIAIISEDVDEFTDRFINALDFGVAYKGKNITPKLFYKIYVDEDFERMVEGVLGIGLEASLN